MYTESILHRLGRAVRGFLLGISAWPPPLLHKRGWQMATLRFSASFYVALRRRRVVYGLAVDTKGITTVARNSPIAFGWCNFGASATHTWTVDTIAPAAPSVHLDVSSNSGSQNDTITNDNTPTISGTAEAGSNVKIYNSQNNVVAS